MTAIPFPGDKPQRKASRFNIEKWGWIYMRASGIVLAPPRTDTGELPMQVNATVLRSTPEALARTLIGLAQA